MQRRFRNSSVLFALVAGCFGFQCKGSVPPSSPSADAPVLEAVKPTTPAVVKAPAPEEKPETCTIQTPLKPGVPGSPGHLIPSERNPNGDSELAVLMRGMVEDLQGLRQTLMNGETPGDLPTGHERMLCAWPTDLDGRNEVFGAMARQYLNTYKKLAGPREEMGARYDAVVESCIHCHENSCRGPIPMIEALRLTAPKPISQ